MRRTQQEYDAAAQLRADRLNLYRWVCKSCGWVNGLHTRKHTHKCMHCRTPRNTRRNVAHLEEETQYALLDRNRRNHRTGCPGKRADGSNGGRVQVQTHPDGVAWG